MIGVYTYYPNACFRASLSWYGKDGESHRIKACYDKNTTFKYNDGWLHAGPDEYSNDSRYLIDVDFWFGCFSYAGRYFYQMGCIPAADGHQHFYGYRVNASLSGYLGLYPPPILLDDEPRWRIEGIDPKKLTVGTTYRGLKMYGNGRMVRRAHERGFYYLNEVGGDMGNLALEVVQLRVAEPK